MKLNDLEFKAEDLDDLFQRGETINSDKLAGRINQLLAERLGKAKRVYASFPGYSWDTFQKASDTRRARLVCIEEIPDCGAD